MRPTAALVLLAFVFAACDSAVPAFDIATPETGAESPPSVLLPLTVGNVWTYRVVTTRLADDGVTVLRVDTLSAPTTIRVTGTVVIAGETWYRIGTGGTFNGFLYTLLANRSDGLYGRSEDATGYAFKLAAYPAPVGFQFGTSTWSGTVDSPQGVTTDSDVTLKVTDLRTTIGTAETSGYLFTSVPQRFRLGRESYEVEAFARPFHHLLVPDVGYAQYQSAYYRVVEPGVMRQVEIITLTLTAYTLVPPPA